MAQGPEKATDGPTAEQQVAEARKLVTSTREAEAEVAFQTTQSYGGVVMAVMVALVSISFSLFLLDLQQASSESLAFQERSERARAAAMDASEAAIDKCFKQSGDFAFDSARCDVALRQMALANEALDTVEAPSVGPEWTRWLPVALAALLGLVALVVLPKWTSATGKRLVTARAHRAQAEELLAAAMDELERERGRPPLPPSPGQGFLAKLFGWP